MTQKVRDVMTKHPMKLEGSAPVSEAAKRMRDADIGAVVVEDGGKVVGIVTDRDIAVRAVADGLDAKRTPLANICSKTLATMSPEDDLDRALELMREKAVRRVPVVESNGSVVGILSLGDVARIRDPKSALGRISAAPPNH